MISSKKGRVRGFVLVLPRHLMILTLELVHTGGKEDKNIETGRVLAGTNIERFWQHVHRISREIRNLFCIHVYICIVWLLAEYRSY